MRILHAKSGRFHEATIEIITKDDWKEIAKSKQFKFDWTKEKKHVIYGLKIVLNNKILGLVAIKDIPKEYRIHIELIENSRSNIGKEKEYDFIAGCMIAYVCELSFGKGYDGFVSLKAKTELVNLYQKKYGFKEMGQFLYLPTENAKALIKKYLDNDEL